MSDERRAFDAEILPGAGGGAFVEIPFRVEEVYGNRGRVKVRATFDGHEYRGSLAPMGGVHVLGLLKGIRAAIGKDIGDRVRVGLELDLEPRTVDVPPELDEALRGAPDVRARFDDLSYTHRREYAQWVAEAKKAETRARRAAKTIEMLRTGATR